MLLIKNPRAGGHAARTYKEGLRRWRRKVRPIALAVCVPLLLLGFVGLFVSNHHIAWFAGALCSLGLTGWIWFCDAPPAYVQNWRHGAEGERKTEKQLRPLERCGWTVVHDVSCRYGNYDHIALGSAGVFLLETKNLAGSVEVSRGVPRQRRAFDPDDRRQWPSIPRVARGSAVALKDQIQGDTGLATWVQPVVVFWSKFGQGVVREDGCVFLHGSHLRAWLEAQSARLSSEDVAAIAGCLERLSSGPVVEELTDLGALAPS